MLAVIDGLNRRGWLSLTDLKGGLLSLTGRAESDGLSSRGLAVIESLSRRGWLLLMN